jgi:hypothetical protein
MAAAHMTAAAEPSAAAEVSAAHSSTHMAAAATTATAVAATTTTAATSRECGCRRQRATERESHCKNDHNLTQHDKSPLRMLSAFALVLGIAIGRPPTCPVEPKTGLHFRS